jgi:curved DNA-binding protein CbpA
MADVTLYDFLGIVPGASSGTVRRAYVDRKRQLERTLVIGAPAIVIDAADRGRKALEAALLILGDPAQRERYDEQICGTHDHPDRASNQVASARTSRSRSRKATVPDVKGLFAPPCQYALMGLVYASEPSA